MYAPEDRNSAHRLKADESYELGVPGHPVRAYLDIGLVVELAQRIGADAIYPGYGFMSENPELARQCAAAGITFVGPPADVLAIAGNKVRAREAARRGGPARPGGHGDADRGRRGRRRPQTSSGFPVFVKAVAGGGGRGMRLVEEPDGAGGAAAAGDARGRGRVRRPLGVPREGGRAPPAHRGAGAGRRRTATWCTCSSATARSSGATRR